MYCLSLLIPLSLLCNHGLDNLPVLKQAKDGKFELVEQPFDRFKASAYHEGKKHLALFAQGELRIWDVATNRLIQTIAAKAISPDLTGEYVTATMTYSNKGGKLCITYMKKGPTVYACILNAETYQRETSFGFHGKHALIGSSTIEEGLKYCDDDTRIALLDYREVVLHDAKTGAHLFTYEMKDDVLHCAISENGKWLCELLEDAIVVRPLIDPTSHSRKYILPAKYSKKTVSVERVVISNDGTHVFVGWEKIVPNSKDVPFGVTTYRLKNGACEKLWSDNYLRYKLNDVMFLSYSTEKNTLAVGTDQGPIFVYDATGGKLIKCLEGATGHAGITWHFLDVKYIPHRQSFLVVTETEAKLCDEFTGLLRERFDYGSPPSGGLAFMRTNYGALFVLNDKNVFAWNGRVMNRVARHHRYSGVATEFVGCNPDGTMMFMSSRRCNDRNCRIGVNVNTMEPTVKYGEEAWLGSDNKGISVYRDDMDKCIKITNVDSYHADLILCDYSTVPTAVAISDDGTQVAIGEEKGLIQLWDVKSRKLIHSYKCEDHKIVKLQFSNDRSVVVAQCESSVLRDYVTAYDTINKKTLWTQSLKDHRIELLTIADDAVISSEPGGEVRSRCLRTGESKLKYECTSVDHVIATKDHLLVSEDDKFCICSRTSGKLLCDIYFFNEGRDWLCLTPDGHYDGTEQGKKQAAMKRSGDTKILRLDNPDTRKQYEKPGLISTILKTGK